MLMADHECRRFQDQVEADLKLPLYQRRGRALWTLGDDFQAALRRIKPRNAAESKAKACALDAGFHWEYHGRQLHNVYTAMRRKDSKKVARYKAAAAAHLVKANRELSCALAYLPRGPTLTHRPSQPRATPPRSSRSILAIRTSRRTSRRPTSSSMGER